MEGFRSLKEGEQVEFTFKKSSKGLESLRVTGPGGGPCAGSERRPKGKIPLQKRKPKGDRWVQIKGVAENFDLYFWISPSSETTVDGTVRYRPSCIFTEIYARFLAFIQTSVSLLLWLLRAIIEKALNRAVFPSICCNFKSLGKPAY